MRAIVLSGGGSKGAYEMGVWAAIRKLNIKYDIVTGTSVGALNAAVMTQQTFYKGLFFWYNLNSKMVFNKEITDNYYTKEGKKNILKMYAKGIINGGMDIEGLDKTIRKVIEPKKFFNSKINMGMITYNVKTLKPKKITKKELNEDNLCDYLIASASCFPAFKIKHLEDGSYIDGGIYDNMPINLAISLGANEIIAVDLKEVGFKQKVKENNVKITYIEPRNVIGSFLIFDKNMSRRAMKLGYNDTLKVMNKLDGNIFTFHLNDLTKNYNKYSKLYINNIKKYLNISKKSDLLDGILKISIIKKILNEKTMKKEYINIIEQLGISLELDETKIYNINKFNKELINKFTLIEEDKKIESLIKQNKFKNLLNNRTTIKYIYDMLETKNRKKLYGLILLFPKSFLQAVYIKTIIEK